MIETSDDLRRLRQAFEPAPPQVVPILLMIVGALAMVLLVVIGVVWNAAGLPVLDEPHPTSATDGD